MFEEEAEEYVSKYQGYGWQPHRGSATFEAMLDCYIHGATYGYNKANEWHFVKDEGLPINKNDGTTYLLYTIYGEGGSPVVAHFVYRDKQELMNVWTGAILTENKIVAWKEIVLPKVIE